ncbi:MAG: oligopeptide/dipeptide ABC transporter ATP-binding protein [Desulfobacterales bacterium]
MTEADEKQMNPVPADDIILEVRDLKKHFPVRSGFFLRVTGWIKAVNGVDFKIRQGQTLGLVGESGCGKSTVARMVMRLLQPDAGLIFFRQDDISRLSEKELKPYRKQMQIVFQDPYGSLNPRMTVGQSIEEGLRIVGIARGRRRRDRLAELLEMVGMSPESAGRYPHEFSGGQRQRIGIARALSVDPALIICDEPISALDVSIQAQVINLLKDLQDRLGLSYLFISHDLNVVGYLCNQVAVMNKGYIMEYAAAEDLYAHPRHPYTQTLLAAIPDVDRGQKKDIQLKDPGPRPGPPPSGCVFQDSCPQSDAACRQPYLALRPVAPDHFVRCWRIDEDDAVRMVPED